MEIIRQFYPAIGKQYFHKFTEYVGNEYEDQDDFVKFIREIQPFIDTTRNIRNCLDHRMAQIEIKDFDLQSTGEIISPTIAMDFNNTTVQRTSLNRYLPDIRDSLLNLFELLIVHLCAKNIKEDKGLQRRVAIIPESERRNKFIKFAVWYPLGPGGFYDQK
ncbi:hypothetical protein SAMN05518672_101857 [Chitinophaga sp. CF118]|uniref:hypothetical protein n=1 Tax=Chitinophaga sp. CF118 TaxID=1884367 RepID=UPI0008EC0540|nr:hypothetical protein [Chitinophaga sp. CF118]SFD17054.1 hypothetical protein SAMN05518672_101857 [Chitinophaga sp. CF118]